MNARSAIGGSGFAGCLLAALGSLAVAAAEPISLQPYIRLAEEDADGRVASLRHDEVGINHSLIVNWDEAALRAALADRQGAPRALSEEARLETLTDLVDKFLAAQAALAGAKASGPGGPRATLEANDAQERFAVTAGEALRSMLAHEQALRDAGARAEADRLKAGAESAILEDYAAVADVIREEIEALRARVSGALEGATRYSIRMRATLVATGGRRRVHLMGYDRIDEFDPMEIPRFQLGLDGRAQQEVEAAGRLAEVVEQAMSGELKDNLRRAAESLKNELEQLVVSMRKDVLEANLREVADQIRASGELQAAPLEREARQLLRTLESLTLDVPPFETETDAELLLRIVRALSSQVGGTVAELRALPSRLDAFFDDVQELARQVPGAITDDARARLGQFVEDLRVNEDIARVIDTFDDVRTALGLTADVASDALGAAEEIPRDVLEQDLDTRLDLLRAGERHSGDVIVLEAELAEGEGDERRIRSRAFRRLRVRQFGSRIEPRGALLFTDSRRATSVDQDWEPSPAFSYMYHYGKRGSRGWNDVFDPGIGVTLTLLDYDDARDFELGVAASVSLFRSLLWVGYGRNIQAESDFFHLGVNPLVIGRLWRERRGVEP